LYFYKDKVRVAVRGIKPLTYEFDVSESVSLNKHGAIANVEWSFLPPSRQVHFHTGLRVRPRQNNQAGGARRRVQIA